VYFRGCYISSKKKKYLHLTLIILRVFVCVCVFGGERELEFLEGN